MTISVPSIEQVLPPWCQGMPFQWQANLDLAYGQVGSDLPLRLAAVLRKQREQVGAELVAHCKQAALPVAVTSERGFLNVHARELGEVVLLTPSPSLVQAIVLDAPTARATQLGFFRLAAHAVMHAMVLGKVRLFLRQSDQFWKLTGDAAQSLRTLWRIGQGQGWDDPALMPISALPQSGLTVVWTVPPESLGIFERDFKQTIHQDSGTALLVRSLPRSHLGASLMSTVEPHGWERAIEQQPVATAALLLRECPFDELDPLVPLLAEAGNVVWLASFVAQRIDTLLEQEISEGRLGQPGSNHPELREQWVAQQEVTLANRVFLFEELFARMVTEGSPQNIYPLVTEIGQAALGLCQSYQVRRSLVGDDDSCRQRYIKLLSSVKARLSSIF